MHGVQALCFLLLHSLPQITPQCFTVSEYPEPPLKTNNKNCITSSHLVELMKHNVAHFLCSCPKATFKQKLPRPYKIILANFVTSLQDTDSAILIKTQYNILSYIVSQLGKISLFQVKTALPMLSSSLQRSSSCFFLFWASLSSAEKQFPF